MWLIDATPDIARQLDMLADVRELPTAGVDRSPLDGLLLTHAHMGHDLALAQLGYEAVSAERAGPRERAHGRRHLTMDRFADRLGPEFELWFVHLNHSNSTLEQRGLVVAEPGREHEL